MSGILRTERLLLRPWRPEDRAPFAELNADPRVMEHFPSVMTREESDGFADRIEQHFAEHGWGLWALERHADGAFLGFTGLQTIRFEAPFTPAIEVAWRLAHHAWGQGYASEAARAALAFGRALRSRIVSFTALSNARSEAVMRRIGMRREGTFEHPLLPPGHRLRTHVLYVADES